MSELLSSRDIEHLFRFEYDRINAGTYDGRLPPFPGVRVGRGIRQYGCCLSKRRRDGSYDLLGFQVTRYLARPEDLLDTIWHEIAHAAAIVFERHTGHGPSWRRHAVRCGADPDRPAKRGLALSILPRLAIATVRCAGACGWVRDYFRVGPVLRQPRRYKCMRCDAGITVAWNRADRD
ncbi:MAG TPA: SprT-like domain-containing protein [Candidatus Thermoplasmatota archaeon]|nr:SprT-like domain-containing protein [Candidatus Thermoplasmatota archaeon]